MLIKAVEISKYGLLKVGDKVWMEQALQLKEKILNNNRDWNDHDRFSHTAALTDTDIEILRAESLDLVDQVKHILFKLGPAHDVLEKLVDKPVSLHRCEGKSWEEIEEHFAVYRTEESILEQKIVELIDLRRCVNCPDETEWVNEVTKLVNSDIEADIDQVTEVIRDKKNNGHCIWSEQLGTLITV
jgi:hypothetical protein